MTPKAKTVRLTGLALSLVFALAACVGVPGSDTVGSGLAWHDVDGNGLQSDGELGIAAVRVELLNGGWTVAVTVTNEDGTWTLQGNLRDGVYSLRFSLPPDGVGWRFTILDAGDDDAIDSDVDPASGQTRPIEVVAGNVYSNIDAGYVRDVDETPGGPANGVIGDFAWHDVDGDGLQGEGELGIGGVAVTLLDATGTTMATAATDPTGFYVFSGLRGGTYAVRFSLPGAGWDYTIPDAGDDTLDSDVDPATGQTGPVTLRGGGQFTDFSIDAGFARVADGAAIGDFVWSDRNGDGLQDESEPGVAGVAVTLRDFNGDPIAATATDDAGLYEFHGLPEGAYSLRFALPTPDWRFTTRHAGSDETLDSDVDPASGTTDPITLAAGQIERSIDAGLLDPGPPGSLGDLVWLDANQDGIQDPGEAGVADVHVVLLDDAGAMIDEELTDLDGLYLFDGLLPGDYRIRFVLPGGVEFSTPDAGGDDTVDSDADPLTGESPIVAVGLEANVTVDAGLVSTAAPTGAIGDFAWHDLDGDGVQDEGEPGLAGITVTLRDETGAALATTTTDQEGLYEFTDLAAGTYTLLFSLPPDPGWSYTPPHAGGDPAIDSDVEPSTGETAPVVLAAGQADLTVDAGYRKAAV